MKTKLAAGWIPATNRSNANVANPIRHYFTGSVSICGKVARNGALPIATVADHALNCANCQRELRKAA
jgi:hypothetical protein